MLLNTLSIRYAFIALSMFVLQVQGQQLQINYYNDHWCGNYGGSLKYYWSWSMVNIPFPMLVQYLIFLTSNTRRATPEEDATTTNTAIQ
ncbi:hypothetical protein IFR05_005185 [Cadophora sp. M221]|nr:hypothetical protein IFR05_005185 [Cadophora sp. M221]